MRYSFGFISLTLVKRLLTLLSLLICSLIIYNEISKKTILPTKSDRINLYTDGYAKGQFKETDEGLLFSYSLENKPEHPYIGFSIYDVNEFFNLHRYTHISIRIKARKGKQIPLIFSEFLEEVEDTNTRLCYRPHKYSVIISDELQSYDIPISKFEVPFWWDPRHKVRPMNISVDFAKIRSFNLQSCQIIRRDINDTILIERIELYRSNRNWYIALILTLLLLLLLHFQPWKIFRKNKINVQYTPAVKEDEYISKDEQWFKLQEYVASYYTTAISMESISTKLGINRVYINQEFQKNTGKSFRQFLNELRVNEAKRLLKETDLNISEVAFKVGYSNTSHFNRVFKSMVGLSPSEFKNKQL